MRKAFIYLALVFVTAVSLSCNGTEVKDESPMRTFLQPLQERDSVLIADQLLYGFELDGVIEGTTLVPADIADSLDKSILSLSPWIIDTVGVTRNGKGNPRTLDVKGTVRIAPFMEGEYELPEIVVERITSDGIADTLIFDPARLEVKTMPVDTATFQPHDIKGQVRYPLTFAELFPWLAGGWLTVLLVILAVCLVIIRRRRNNPAFEHKEPAHIVALRKLDQYRGNKMWAPEKQKAFYSGVTDTLREYISERYGIGAMEMTTAELFDDLKDTEVSKELASELRDLFDRADFVKFAKYVASEEDNASVLPLAVRFVTETYQADVESNDGGEN